MNKNKIIIVDWNGKYFKYSAYFEKYCSNVLSSDKDEILSADKLVYQVLELLERQWKSWMKAKFDKVIQTFVKLNKPLLGICLGITASI